MFVPELERFSRHIKIGENGCLFWSGAKNSAGYGQFVSGRSATRNKKVVCAHRWIYEYFNGVINKDTYLTHNCQNRHCINLDHLQLIPKKILQPKKEKTHCYNGHIWSKENWNSTKTSKYCKLCRAQYIKTRRESDIQYKLLLTLRTRLASALRSKNIKKQYKIQTLLGCTVKELKQYLESKFQKEMSWENYGLKGWHIDHIIPCTSFDLTKKEEQRKCFHYTNLQPLWCNENLRKSGK